MRARALAAAVAALLVLVLAGPTALAQEQDREGDQAPLVLSDQTTLVPSEGTFSVAVQVPEGSGAVELRIDVHDRARSRTELARAVDTGSSRPVLRSTTTALPDLSTGPDGSRRASLDLAGGAGRAVTTPGVYPVRVAALDASGDVVGQLQTELVVLPEAAAGAPPLAVALVAELGQDPVAPPQRTSAQAVADALVATADVPATLAVSPDLLEALAASTDPSAAALLDALRTVAASHPVLDLPYVPVAPDALADAGLAGELRHQRDRGREVLESLLGVEVRDRTWLARPGLGGDGLRMLRALGIRQAVVPPDAVERVVDGVLSPARPFELAPPRPGGRRPTEPDAAVQALLADAGLAAAVATDAEPALVAARTLGDLAQLWFEQPGTARAAVLRVDDAEVDGEAVRRILEGLRSTALFRAVALDDAFERASPFLDGTRDVLRRSLVPDDTAGITATVAEEVRRLRSLRDSVEAMVGDGSAALHTIDRHLLRSSADGLSSAERRRELATARTAVEDLDEAVSSPERFTITLTAREGTVPLTIRNDTGAPVQVRLRFSSGKLDLPDGRDRTLTLTEQTTRLDVAVRTRASGSFPFSVDITSPDGAVPLSTTVYNVRSTAVSGVGLLLSIGAGLFLVVWWARHWRESKATKLVDGPTEPT